MTPDIGDLLGDILVPLVGASIFQFLSWSYMRSVHRGQPLTPVMKGMLRYGFFGALGMGYIFAAGSLLRWPIHGWYALTLLWFAFLGGIAYWRYRNRTRTLATGDNRRSARWTYFLEALPLVGLLVCLVGTAIECDLILEGHGALVPSIFWPAGVLIAIVSARRNRRATVVTAFRAFSGLLLIGALARRPSVAGFVVASIACVVLFILSRYVSAHPRPTADLREHRTGSTA